MFRKLFPILPVLAALYLAVSCDPNGKEPVVNDTLTVSPESISFEAEDKAVKLVYVSTEKEWTATASESWIHVNKTSGTGKATLEVKADANAEADRSGTITVKGSKTATVSVTQKGKNIETLVPIADAFDGTKLASTTYQLLIYSFADSDGDGIGDFKGIQNRLDYLNDLGATALWLSPAHPSDSYHAYDVTDYYSLNELYGSEDDFRELINAAHDKGIKIYMDYVLNHSGKGHPWFKQALADPSSPYRDYYFFSSNPSKEYSSFPMLKSTAFHPDEWKQGVSGSPKLTITKTDEALTTGSSDWNLWFWQGSSAAKELRFKDRGDGTMYLVMDINGDCGILLRRFMNWDAGSKFGALDSRTLKEGEPLDLVWNGDDINFKGSGRYKIEISNLSVKTVYFMGCFSEWMPDLNYGDPNQAESNACFQELAASADKWINMGIDGLRLDAVKHICGGISSYNNTHNQTLLKKWYDHCNATFHAAGHEGEDIFMVGEVWDDHEKEKYYYKGINSCFEFGYFGTLTSALNGDASEYVSTVTKFLSDHTDVRPDAITSMFMSNHDQDRAAESLSRNLAKEKQAAAMLLTTPGKPFIYQGEELGYYGRKNNGDEYVRTPILWDKAGKDCAKKGVNNTVDSGMLTSSISVEAQNADAGSLLNVYKTWSRVRNTYPALAEGTMTAADLGAGKAIGSWYMTSGSDRMLVIHNTSAKENTVTVTFDVTKPVAILGTVTLDHDILTLAGNSSVVFKL